MSLRSWLALIVFALVAVPGRAQTSEDISARLEARLKALPDRWDTIPPPLIPVSGRSSEEVLATASEEEQALVSERITFLALSPPTERAALISRELPARPLSEVDVWLPEKFTDELRTANLEEPTLYVEAWLEWAEALGRKDALLVAASLGLERLALRAESRSLLETASRWVGLPSPDYATRGRADVLSQYAARLFAAGESDKALDAYGRARELFEQAGDRRGRGNTFMGEADVLSVLGDSEKAIDAYKHARELFEQVGDGRGQGNTFNGEASVLLVMGDKQKALDACKRARQFLEDVGDRRGQGNTFLGEAGVLFRLGDNEKALDAYKRARKLFEDIGYRRGQGDTFYGEADVLSQLGDNEKALDTYKHAHKLYEAVGHRLGEGLAFFGEANVLYLLRDYDKAFDAYIRARKLFEHIGYRWGQGNMLMDEAYIEILLGKHDKALDAYRRARKLFEQVGSRQEEGDTWVGEGEVLFMLGESETALDAYKRAHKLFEQLGDRRGQGNAFRNEADILAQMGENEKAINAYRSARELFEQIGLTLGLGGSLLGEARLQSRQGNKNEAKNLASQAVAAYRKAGAVNDERSAWLIVAEAEHSLGNLEPAVSAAREAVRLHAAWRFKRIYETQRAYADESISAAYDILVPGLWSLARTEEALAAAEKARSHVLLDLLAAGFKHGKTGTATELRAERRRLESELAQVETESRQAADAGRLAELQRRRNRIDAEFDWNQYQTLAAEQNALLTAEPLDTVGIRAFAHETGPILLYYAADKELIGFLVPADGTDVFAARIDLSRDRLTEAVQRYIHDVANPFYTDRAVQQSRELWDLLLAPFVARLPPGGPLVIVPHGPLHELPFETFLDPAGTPLFERWAVSFAPSVSTLALSRERHKKPQPKDSFLVFSSGRGLDLLEAEAGEVAQLFGNDKAAFKPTEASFENYENLVSGARHLLISTTGTWTPRDSRKTFLEILPTPGVHDSRLSVVEIAATPLTAELVALEACDTARGETRQTDERIDLTRAFLIAGAASVLSTRWKVPDEPATTHFLLDFYRAYRQGGPGGQGLRKDQALTEARRRSRERGDPAQVWAAWMLVGDAR
ncbi:MAG TPA: CHAT domain-containing tetratricopeptide repeat protein [Thermoanaerobaculia bacterium]|nr:CHAT domain-containing tetratricopeptide repeat protein [Thermoanaerobaculia bacterium]